MSEDGKGNSTMGHDVVTLTVGIVRTKVLTEKWDGSNYYIKAKDLALYASKYHNPQGLVVLGYLYENGQEVEEDTEKAFAYYSEAAKLGSPFGMFQLGRLYQKGIGVAKDKFETAKWYKKAANLGHKKSARKLERMKESGHCC